MLNILANDTITENIIHEKLQNIAQNLFRNFKNDIEDKANAHILEKTKSRVLYEDMKVPEKEIPHRGDSSPNIQNEICDILAKNVLKKMSDLVLKKPKNKKNSRIHRQIT
ncbi:hypothetical protein EDEG_01119 [Edhazardia aedis USNM 41457]|uniref:Uncharacterized protein n=1 Tax=Edhazardia aedis (strain USNM 41457) TaxID=1003232 RepID=J9DAB1_EDHAE|nr:hypothetical protein EDEG_01119 [Edhazardia aedis USNM 41457]|eukprot:EJW04671.1 hypothetical protein EDEG_01119 [Edhazardia aedis USNM 41457]